MVLKDVDSRKITRWHARLKQIEKIGIGMSVQKPVADVVDTSDTYVIDM